MGMMAFVTRFIKFIIVLFFLCGVFLALLPKLASTNWGRIQLTHWINRSIPGKLEIQRLDLHWGKGQVLEGILLKDPEGQSVLGIEKVSTDATLVQILRNNVQLGFTQIQDFNAAIVTDEKGWTNLQRALGIPSSNATPPLSPSTIILSDVYADLNLFTQHPVSGWIKGLTEQENLKGSFEINFSLNGFHASDWKGLKKNIQNYLSIEGSKEAKLQGHVVNFPVDLIDRLIALKNPRLNGVFHALLGDRLNLTIDKEPSQEGLAFHLTTLAPLMQGIVKGKVVNGVFSLQEEAIFDFKLNPDLVNPLTHHWFELLNFSNLKILFSDFSLPLNFLDEEDIDACLFGFNAELLLPETEIDVRSTGRLNIQSLRAHLEAPACEKIMRLSADGEAQHDNEPFRIHVDSSLTKPRNFSDLVKQMNQNLQASFTISNLPLQLIPIFQEHPEWEEQTGSSADAQLTVFSKGIHEWETILSLQTPRLSLQDAQFRIGKEVSLTSPAQLNWSGSKDCLSAFLKKNEFILDEPCHLQFTLNQFQIPLDHPKSAIVQFESTIPHLHFSKLLPWGIIHVQDLNLKIDGQNLTHFHSQLKGQLSLLTPDGLDSPLLDTPLQFTQKSYWKMESDGKVEMLLGQLQLNNSISNVKIEAHSTPNHELELTQPAQIQYTLTPRALEVLNKMLDKKEWPKLHDDARLYLKIDPTSFNLNSFALSSLQIQGTLSTDHLALQNSSGSLPILNEIVVPWVIDAPMNNFYVDVKGLVYTQENPKPGNMTGHIQIWPQQGNFDLAHAQTEIHMNFAGMPTSLFNIFLTKPDLNLLWGPTIDLNFKTLFDPTNTKPGYLDITLNSSQIHFNGRFKLDDAISLFNPNKLPTIRLTITPKSYQYLQNFFAFQNGRELSSPFTLSGSLSQVYLPLNESLLDHSHFDFRFSSTDIKWEDSTTPPVQFEGNINSQNLAEQILFSLHINSSSPSLTLHGTLTNALDPQMRLRNWQEMGLKANLQGKRLTPDILQHLFLLDREYSQKLEALLGESFEVAAQCQLQNLNGPIQASAGGPQGQFLLDGQIKQGVLFLNQPFEGSVKMTPLLTQTFLSENVPILSSAMEAENPLKFTIDPSQFSCPLTPFKLDQVKIGKGTLDIGKIKFRNEGPLKSVLSFIHASSDPYLTIWFTPLYFQLDHGILKMKRLDMLIANSYTLASWGDINLNNHYGDLVLGLSAQSLQYAFGIQGLDEQYILQIPLHSSGGKVEIDKMKASGRISSLIAKTQGGSRNKILGNILDLALDKPGNSPPPPTTQPFPWKEEFVPSTTSEKVKPPSEINPSDGETSEVKDNPEGKKKKKKKNHKERDPENNIKDLRKGAKQILDQLMGQ
jgi:hypothetical protein